MGSFNSFSGFWGYILESEVFCIQFKKCVNEFKDDLLRRLYKVDASPKMKFSQN